MRSFDTGHPVSSVHWSRFEKELFASHSEGTTNMYCWSYPSMSRSKELCGHKSTVLHTAVSPNGKKIVSIGPDDSVRFWDVFQEPQGLVTQPVSESGLYSIIR